MSDIKRLNIHTNELPKWNNVAGILTLPLTFCNKHQNRFFWKFMFHWTKNMPWQIWVWKKHSVDNFFNTYPTLFKGASARNGLKSRILTKEVVAKFNGKICLPATCVLSPCITRVNFSIWIRQLFYLTQNFKISSEYKF